MPQESLTEEETAFIARVVAQAVHEGKQRLETTRVPPPPIYLFFAHHDEHGAPFPSIRACALACAGYDKIPHWIGHGSAVAMLTDACAVALVSLSTFGDPDDPARRYDGMISILNTVGAQMCAIHALEPLGDGTVKMHPPEVTEITVNDPMALRPLKPGTSIPADIADGASKLLELLGSPVWLPIEIRPVVRA